MSNLFCESVTKLVNDWAPQGYEAPNCVLIGRDLYRRIALEVFPPYEEARGFIGLGMPTISGYINVVFEKRLPPGMVFIGRRKDFEWELFEMEFFTE